MLRGRRRDLGRRSLLEELLADGGEELAGLVVIAEADGDAAGDLVEAETFQGASLLGGQGGRQEGGVLRATEAFGRTLGYAAPPG